MQDQNQASAAGTTNPGCTFCRRREIAAYLLKETAHFRIVSDFAPLLEGHILIIPHKHYACYGAVPASLDAELAIVKDEVKQFLTRYYAPVIHWEHGVFRQTVFHAHLHCLPLGVAGYTQEEQLHSHVVNSQEDIRAWYTAHGQYFYMADEVQALLFTPEEERYLHVIKNVLGRGVAARTGQSRWRTPQQRREEGGPLRQALAEKWRLFQQDRADVTGDLRGR